MIRDDKKPLERAVNQIGIIAEIEGQSQIEVGGEKRDKGTIILWLKQKIERRK